MLTGRPGGEIIWRGKPVVWDSPKAANDMGVATIHQHIPLVPTLSVLENVFLGNTVGGGVVRSIRQQFDELCDRVGYWMDPDALVGDLSIGERQMVAILQALGTGADLIVMDEPTASLAARGARAGLRRPCGGCPRARTRPSCSSRTFSTR